MKKVTIGIVIIILGVMMFIYTGINFITTKNVVEVGPIDIRREVNHPVQWSPIVGVAFVIVGGAILVRGKRLKE